MKVSDWKTLRMSQSNLDGTELEGSFIWSFGPQRNPYCIGELWQVYVRNWKESTFSPGGFHLLQKVIFYIYIVILNMIYLRTS
jgi:hypothetical protein